MLKTTSIPDTKAIEKYLLHWSKIHNTVREVWKNKEVDYHTRETEETIPNLNFSPPEATLYRSGLSEYRLIGEYLDKLQWRTIPLTLRLKLANILCQTILLILGFFIV